MTPPGAETFKAAVYRSRLLIVILPLLGIAAVNLFDGLAGPRYEGHAHVLLSAAALSRAVTGAEPGFVDPQRVADTALALTRSPAVYARAATATQGKLGDGDALDAATSVTGGDNNDILTFTATSSRASRAVAIANAVAGAYVRWRADLVGETIQRAIRQLEQRRAELAPNAPEQRDLRAELNRLRLLEPVAASDVTLLDRATQAAKTRPAPVRASLLGFSLGLVIALLAAAVREAIDTTVRSDADVEEILAAPVLGRVQSLPRRKRLVTYGRDADHFSDVYGLLGANLVHESKGQTPLVVAVTSAVPAEGKTITAANLAVVLARRGARVAVADFDVRKATLGRTFGIPARAPGVLDVLAGKTSVAEASWTVALEGARPRTSNNGTQADVPAVVGAPEQGELTLLPAGSGTDAKVWTRSPKLGPLVEGLRQTHDFVILDTSPVLLSAEMAELSQVADVVLVVVRQGRVTHRSLRSVAQQAERWPTSITGAVLTDVARTELYSSPYYGGN